ncbi:MAG TPA: phage capsid protein [Edaphobacter sp.]|nr:phage capsid protein [Edaphobacter sp.]
MSTQITTAFVQQYKDNVMLLVQQKGSRLRGSTLEENVTGENAYFEQIGATAARRVNERHGDSPLMNTPHKRRRVSLVDYDWGDLIDKPDRVRTLVNFDSPYVQNAGFAMGRGIDQEIIMAFFAVAYTGKEGTTQVNFPAGQQIAANFGGATSGLTVEKLREARKKLRANNVDMTEKFHIAVTAIQMDNLLGTTQVTSQDFNTVKALVQGDVNTFMGFDFKHTELLELDTNSHRRIPAWATSGMGLAIGQEPMSRIVERADKRFATYVYYCMTIGATRVEEEKVVEIKCAES